MWPIYMYTVNIVSANSFNIINDASFPIHCAIIRFTWSQKLDENCRSGFSLDGLLSECNDRTL